MGFLKTYESSDYDSQELEPRHYTTSTTLEPKFEHNFLAGLAVLRFIQEFLLSGYAS
jgi:hypothetical protein